MGKLDLLTRSCNSQNKDCVTDSDESVYHHTSDQEVDVGFHEVQDVSSQVLLIDFFILSF